MLAAAAVALALTAAACDAAAEPALRTQSKQELERLKLAEETAKLRHENDRATGWSGFFTSYAPFLTALAAVGGLLATIRKQSSDQSEQRRRDREQRETESERRREDRFAAILSDLGSERVATKAGAAASLVTYLQAEHRRFHHQVRVAVLTNLKLDHEEPIRKLLARVYVTALRSDAPVDQFERDLSRAKLANTDLTGVDLREADMAFADLRHCALAGADLTRARGLEVTLEGARLGSERGRPVSLIEVRFRGAHCDGADFSGARLVNAHLQEAELRDARFYGSRLQAAHLEQAKLTGARFQRANISDAYFHGAEFDLPALRSITRSFGWRKAHFDPDVRATLERLSGE